MGLDVHLTYCENWDEEITLQNQYNLVQEELNLNFLQGRSFNDLSEDERNNMHEKAKNFANELGLSEYGESQKIRDVVIPKDFRGYVKPEGHIFDLGYFRSSYHSAGINSVASEQGFPSLYDIFPEAESGDNIYVAVDWGVALERVTMALDTIDTLMKTRVGNFIVERLSFNPFVDPDTLPTTENEALKLFEKEYGHHANIKPDCSPWGKSMNYSNRNGNFYMNGTNLKAIILGMHDSWRGTKEPVMFAVIDLGEDGHDPLKWCREAYRIVELTIRWVLEQDDPSQYRLLWSA